MLGYCVSLLFSSQVTTQSVLVHLSRNNITLIDITVTQRSRLFSHIFYGFCHKTILGFFLIVRVNAVRFYLLLYSKTPRALSLSSLELFTWNLFLDRLLLITRQYKGHLYTPPLFFFNILFFLSTWLVRWTWPKLYTSTGQEWENRKYKLFDQ